jgi:lambda family phage portal protein
MTVKKINIKANWVDNAIGFFSPVKKAERLRAKYQTYFLENVTRKYDGASRGRRTSGWHSTNSSASLETENSLHTLRNRSRDLRRNSGYVARGIQVITSNVVGKGIRIKFNGRNKTQEKKINDLWKLWAGSNAIDFDGRLNLNMIQDIACDAVVESGEVVIRKRNVSPTRENPFPIQVQVLESDFIDDSFGSFSHETGDNIVQGIEFDKQGRRKGYRLYKIHPGSQFINNESMFVEAKNIIHAFRGDRPGQIRGIPWASPIMMNVKDLEDYEDTELIRQKIAACFTAFIVDQETGNGLTKEEIDDVERFEPGMIEKLSAGKNIVLSNPPTVENYNEYISTMLHKVAVGFGISYESLSSD